MRFTPVLASLCLLFSGASYAVASAADLETTVAPAGSASRVTVENPARLKGLNRVAIGSFTVDILDRLESTADIGGIELVTGAPSQLVVTLVGADRARYQSLVDTAYDRFVADLTAKGFAVIPQSELQADPEFRKLISPEAAAARDERSPAGSNRYLSAASLPIYLVDETTLFPKMSFRIIGPKPKRDPYIGWGSSLGSGFAAMGFQRQHAAAKSIGAPILNVRITLLGGQAQINRDFWKTAGSARTDAAMRFVALYNRVLVIGPDQGMARIALSEDFATDRLGDLVSTTSGGSRALQTAGNTAIVASRVLGSFVPGGGLIGAMHYTNKNTYEVRTDQATFETALNGGFGKVSDILTSALSDSR